MMKVCGQMQDLNKKHVTVVGAGVSGRGLALLAHRLGADVFVSEKKDGLSADTQELFQKNGIKWECGGNTDRAFEADLVLLSSGIPPASDCVRKALSLQVPMMGELDFVAPHIRAKIVGVTGSNGKTTLTSLIGHILKKSGVKAGVGGNIGEAAALFTQEPFDYVVLELSSFQLYWTHNLRTAVAAVTNLAPDHIDWHGSYQAYVEAKSKVISLQGPEGWSVIQDRDFDSLHVKEPAHTVVLSWQEQPQHKAGGSIFMGRDAAYLWLNGAERKLFDYSEIKLFGDHNLENVAMAMTVTELLSVDCQSVKILDDFHALPHRCELAGVVDGVTYIDDSKGTNVAASVTAMTSIKGRKVVILGGQGKGEDYAPLAKTVLKEADAAVLLGTEKDAIERALKNAGFQHIYKVKDMSEAVRQSKQLAKEGMVVLLSPACTSWDMYESYKKRGEHFCQLVRELEGKA